MSRGATEIADWKGLGSNSNWTRHEAQHATLTVTIYYGVNRGVPTEVDVCAAIDDLEQLYAALGTGGRLRDMAFSGVTDPKPAPLTYAVSFGNTAFPVYQ